MRIYARTRASEVPTQRALSSLGVVGCVAWSSASAPPVQGEFTINRPGHSGSAGSIHFVVSGKSQRGTFLGRPSRSPMQPGAVKANVYQVLRPLEEFKFQPPEKNLH